MQKHETSLSLKWMTFSADKLFGLLSLSSLFRHLLSRIFQALPQGYCTHTKACFTWHALLYLPGAHSHSIWTFVKVRSALAGLTLDNAAVWRKEDQRQKSPEHPNAPWFIQWPYLSICWIMDVIYDKRPIQRFWFLETVARMPYFAFISMLHLYESLGWWRAGAELRRV